MWYKRNEICIIVYSHHQWQRIKKKTHRKYEITNWENKIRGDIIQVNLICIFIRNREEKSKNTERNINIYMHVDASLSQPRILKKIRLWLFHIKRLHLVSQFIISIHRLNSEIIIKSIFVSHSHLFS